MLVAVLTCTRERLDYTKHCFQTLRDNAGCEFHHYVLDQDSKDGTTHWLANEHNEGRIFYLSYQGQNIGISAGINVLVDKALRHGGYDAIVKVDNDCELTQPDTLLRAATVARDGYAIVSPIVDGLRSPPNMIAPTERVGNETIRLLKQIGGIFMATPIGFWDTFRLPQDELPKWGEDDSLICMVARGFDMPVGYLDGLRVRHYETTDGQHERYPEYFERRVEEGGPE